jgi:ketosteroid isomerase-like protein
MPWFPDFAAAAELARRETREAGHADPVAQYFAALDKGDTRALEKVWPGEVLIHDPRAGVIRGHKQLKRFVEQNRDFWATRLSHVEAVASTYDGGRAVVEVMVHLVLDGAEMPWPIAVVAESPDDRSVVFRTYCSQVPVTRRHEVRPPVLDAGIGGLDGAVGRYQAAVEAGDVDEVVKTFAPDGYVREPIGPHAAHRGTRELRAFFTRCFSAGGGIGFRNCAVTDDGLQCAVEYNCVRWGSYDLPPQAGIAVFERGSDGLLAATRVYDDVEAPVARPTRG